MIDQSKGECEAPAEHVRLREGKNGVNREQLSTPPRYDDDDETDDIAKNVANDGSDDAKNSYDIDEEDDIDDQARNKPHVPAVERRCQLSLSPNAEKSHSNHFALVRRSASSI